jgi:hypothetical protein
VQRMDRSGNLAAVVVMSLQMLEVIGSRPSDLRASLRQNGDKLRYGTH